MPKPRFADDDGDYILESDESDLFLPVVERVWPKMVQ